jgi:hypothetical protein
VENSATPHSPVCLPGTDIAMKRATRSLDACDKYGHKQVDCPDAQYGALQSNPYKKSCKTPKNQDRPPPPQPSQELMKSIHSPGGKNYKQAK